MSSYEAAAAPVAAPHAPRPAKRSLSTRWISVLTLVTLLAVWWAVTAAGLIEPLFLPPPSAVLQKGWLLATTGYMDATLWQHLGASLSRIGLGLGFAILTAVPVGIAIGHNRIARGIFDPLIEFYRPIPPLAYLPLIVICRGSRPASTAGRPGRSGPARCCSRSRSGIPGSCGPSAATPCARSSA